MNLLNHEVILELFRDYYLLFVMCLYSGAFALTYYLIPKVLWVSKEKNLTTTINSRSAHIVETPSFGGVAFYITIIMVLTLIQTMRLTFVGNQLIAAMTILFMVGLKDDLVISTAKVKIFGQIAAACFVVFSPEMQLTTLYGFLGIYEIPEAVGFIITALIVVALINAYNLIDGIDGLAAIVGIIISMVYAWVFYGTGQPYFVLISISLAGILSAYLRFNFSRGHRKIFMGDSGSLIVGLILASLTVKHLVMVPYEPLVAEGFDPANRPLFLLCLLFIPVFDTLRVMSLRILRCESPFAADRNHAHHVMIDLGFSHFKASVLLALFKVLIIGVYLFLSNKLPHFALVLLVVGIYAGSFLLLGRLKRTSEKIVLQNANFKPEKMKPAVNGVHVEVRKNSRFKVKSSKLES
ncbi:MAG: MraY family glycosyltransferase [Bacteroidota bacterium]